ncbi:GntR family transcriptional regulator [Sphingomonas profundi]|uniref:GntR family transcriptional regulator n=1 Tax=Alterirhizorhabdus profundi TaxID=2681549 RepID=UPI0012E7E0CE|nr:GntR family transcriptional regulator [Sphingomonas profundi]
MPLGPDILQPIDRADRRRTAVEVYEALQSSILAGRLKPGTVLSQVEVARLLNVSRTPVREAMRMLQEGGLLVGEPNYRSRVLGFDPEDIEALYMKRVVLEAMAVSITTRRMTPALLADLKDVVAQLESDEGHEDFECWQQLHRRLHHLIVSEAGTALVEELASLELRSGRYQSASKGAHLPGWWMRGEAEHRALLDAIAKGDALAAGELSARHLARTALELLAALAPEYDSSRLRESLRFAISGAAASGKRH